MGLLYEKTSAGSRWAEVPEELSSHIFQALGQEKNRHLLELAPSPD
jgi:hypothetical protein